MKLNIAKDFSPNPFGRYESDGPNSGERFREILQRKLEEAIRRNEHLHVELDDVPIGLGSSFLDESFAGLINQNIFDATVLHKYLIIDTEFPSYETEIWSYIDEAREKA
ncbi:STAS-like domain-containing protein [Shewanella algae]|uniref:STAS-like domain-containing protein n=1 Tax=Shewanella algae TaxID=38313 RepID=UPI0031F4D23D